MNCDLFIGSTIGYKNILKKRKSQDYIDYKLFKNSIICAVADGHSTSYFKYSDKGAELACKASIDVLENYINEDKDFVKLELEKMTIQQKIYARWMELVNEHFKSINPVVLNTQYLKYSTTLLVTLITESFILFLKLGDGNIVIENRNKYEKIIDNINRGVVQSFGRSNSYLNINYKIEDSDIYRRATIILFTDGYENSFEGEKILYESLKNTLNKYNKNVFSRFLLEQNYEKYLSKLSKNVSFDDISIVFLQLKY
ncbi:MAG: protein phosphatase 2C domain-containing protein [Peptostreptococcaceae bacterium]